MNLELQTFIDSLVPKNLSKTKREKLLFELEAHALDKADSYEELGYSKEESLNLAIHDMGESEETRISIRNEFERLYHERTWWAIVAGVVCVAVNLLFGFGGYWVTSADYNTDPNTEMNLMSFGYIFLLLFAVIFAKDKGYRKTLTAIGAANALIGLNFLYCFFPQAAFFSIETNVLFLLDRFTPFSAWQKDPVFWFYLCVAALLALAMYCFFSAAKAKKRSEKKGLPLKSKLLLFGAVYLFVAGATCLVYPSAKAELDAANTRYIYDYASHVGETDEEIFALIEKVDDYNEAVQILKEHDLLNSDAFSKTLDRSGKKVFSAQLKALHREDDTVEIWLPKEGQTLNRSLFYLKKDENGKLIAKGVGSDLPFSNELIHYFRPLNVEKVSVYVDSFKTLKFGAGEEEAVAIFKEKTPVSKFVFLENGKTVTVLRFALEDEIPVYSYDFSRFEYNYAIFELRFSEGKLISGELIAVKKDSSLNVIDTERVSITE